MYLYSNVEILSSRTLREMQPRAQDAIVGRRSNIEEPVGT